MIELQAACMEDGVYFESGGQLPLIGNLENPLGDLEWAFVLPHQPLMHLPS